MRSFPSILALTAAAAIACAHSSRTGPQRPPATAGRGPVALPGAAPEPQRPQSTGRAACEHLLRVRQRGPVPDSRSALQSFFDSAQNRPIPASASRELRRARTREYNLALGQRRADAARATGATGARRQRISTVSYGNERPRPWATIRIVAREPAR